jgi:hypothetical protein
MVFAAACLATAAMLSLDYFDVVAFPFPAFPAFIGTVQTFLGLYYNPSTSAINGIRVVVLENGIDNPSSTAIKQGAFLLKREMCINLGDGDGSGTGVCKALPVYVMDYVVVCMFRGVFLCYDVAIFHYYVVH